MSPQPRSAPLHVASASRRVEWKVPPTPPGSGRSLYAWLRAIPALQSKAEAEAELRGHIGRIFAAGRRVYGSPRVHAELRREGLRHSRRLVERLMREMGLSARRGRRRTPRTTDSRHDLPVAPNLLDRDCPEIGGLCRLCQ
jgi:transposase InsO family protein